MTAITSASYKSATIDDWTNGFWEVYQVVDRDRPVSGALLNLVDTSMYLLEGVRTRKYGEATVDLAHVFCWLCSLVHKCSEGPLGRYRLRTDKEFGYLVYEKYPARCWKCGRKPCVCLSIPARISSDETLKEFVKQKRMTHKSPRDGQIQAARDWFDGKGTAGIRRDFEITAREWSLDRWIREFEDIYPHVEASVESVCLHLMEEIGELAREIWALEGRDDREEKAREHVSHLEFELADTFSWTASLFAKLRYYMTGAIPFLNYLGGDVNAGRSPLRLEFSEVCWREYGLPNGELGCFSCQASRCTCSQDREIERGGGHHQGYREGVERVDH